MQNYIKQTLDLVKVYYYSYYNIIHFICTILVYFCLGKIFSLAMNDNFISIYDINKNYTLIKTLPSITCIKDNFYHKNDVINNYMLVISKLNININTWYKSFSELVIVKTNNRSSVLDYFPSTDITSYYPLIQFQLSLIKDLITDLFKSQTDIIDKPPKLR